MYFDEFLNFKKQDYEIAAASSRALGALIGKYKSLDNMGYETYEKCYRSNVCSVLDYGAEV